MSSWDIIGWGIIASVVGPFGLRLALAAVRLAVGWVMWRRSLKIEPAPGQIWSDADGKLLYVGQKHAAGHFTVYDYDPTLPAAARPMWSWSSPETPEQFERLKQTRGRIFVGTWNLEKKR